MKDPATGNSVYMDEYLPQQSKIQDTKYGPMSGQEAGGALARPRLQQPKPNLSGIDQIFPQLSPSGGGASSLVGAGVAQGAPGGDTSWMPNWMNVSQKPQEAGMVNAQPDWMNVSQRPEVLSQAQPKSQRAGMTNWMPDWMNISSKPTISPEQTAALQTIAKEGYMPGREPYTGSGTPKAPSKLRFDMTNYFPGNDYGYLQKLFPGLSVEQILAMIEDPNYQ
jgi:hypothetical protein